MRDLRKQYNLREKFAVWLSKRLLVVYTVGKVGTLSVCGALERAGFKHVHPHSLYYTWPGIYFLRVDLNWPRRIFFFLRSCYKRIAVFIWRSVVPEVKIITGIRDPFSRSISAYFEQVHYNGGIPDNASFDAVRADFESRVYFDAQDIWLTKELCRLTGLESDNLKFCAKAGYAIWSMGKFKIFIYRLDKLATLEEEISSFVGEPLKLSTDNLTKNNPTAVHYLEFKEKYRFPEEISLAISKSNVMQTFFSAEEALVLYDKYTDV